MVFYSTSFCVFTIYFLNKLCIPSIPRTFFNTSVIDIIVTPFDISDSTLMKTYPDDVTRREKVTKWGSVHCIHHETKTEAPAVVFTAGNKGDIPAPTFCCSRGSRSIASEILFSFELPKTREFLCSFSEAQGIALKICLLLLVVAEHWLVQID